MLKILINGAEVDLGTLKGVTLQYNPGIFELDGFVGSYTVPFTLPDSPINAAIFAFQNKTNAYNKEIVEYSAEIWHSGILMASGKAKATSFPKGGISCTLYIDNGGVFSTLTSKNLPENYFGGMIAQPSGVQNVPDTSLYCLYQVKNTAFYDDTIFDALTGPEHDNQNYWTGSNFYFDEEGPCIITPFPYLHKVLEYLFTIEGYKYIDNFFVNAMMRSINIFNTVNAVKHNNLAGYSYNIQNTLDGVDIANHLPNIPTTDFLKAVFAFFNICLYVHGNTIELIDRSGLYLSDSYDDLTLKQIGLIEKTLVQSESGLSINILRDENDTNLPDLPDVSQIKGIEKVIWFPNIDEREVGSMILLQSSPYEMGVYYKLFRKTTGPVTKEWKPFYQPINPDKFEQSRFLCQTGIYLGNLGRQINANLSCLPVRNVGAGLDTYDKYIPEAIMPGNSLLHDSENAFSLRLMCYNGLADVEGQNMPWGFYALTSLLSITGAYCHFRNDIFLNWYNEAAKEEFECELQLRASEIKNFDFTKKKLIDGNLFFVTSMKVQLLRYEINPAVCTLMKA